MTVLKIPDIKISDYSVREVRLRFCASDGSEFIMDVNADGLKFYADESSAGHSHDKPVIKTVDDIWHWVGKCGERVALFDRMSVLRSRERNSKNNS